MAFVLVQAVSCCKQTTISSKLRQILGLVYACRKPPSNPQNVQPFELEELLEGTNYATIVRSPWFARQNVTPDSESKVKPVSAPRISILSGTAPVDKPIYELCKTRSEDILSPLDDSALSSKDPKIFMKKFKDLEGDYKYKCKLCTSVFLTHTVI